MNPGTCESDQAKKEQTSRILIAIRQFASGTHHVAFDGRGCRLAT